MLRMHSYLAVIFLMLLASVKPVQPRSVGKENRDGATRQNTTDAGDVNALGVLHDLAKVRYGSI